MSWYPLEPAEEHVQARLRLLIGQAPNGHELARLMGLPVSTLYAAAAGARLNIVTRKRVDARLAETEGLDGVLADMRRKRQEEEARQRRWHEFREKARAEREAKRAKR